MVETIITELKMAEKEPAWLNHIIRNNNIDQFTIDTCREFIREDRDKDAAIILNSALN